MFRLAFVLSALVACADAFTPLRPLGLKRVAPTRGAPLCMSLGTVLKQVEEKGLLTKVAELGVLTKAEKAGITLKDLEPLLVLADENGAMDILADTLEWEGLPALIDAAPGLLPLAGTLLSVPPPALTATAVASLGAAVAEISIIPDDSIPLVAAQTFLAVILGAVVPAASLVGAAVLGYKK